MLLLGYHAAYYTLCDCGNRQFQANKKDPAASPRTESLLVEHLEKSSPLIIEEIRRWRDLIWDDYLEHKYRTERPTDTLVPSGYVPHTPELTVSGKTGSSGPQSPYDLDNKGFGS